MGELVRLDETLYSFGSFNFADFVQPVGWRWTDGESWTQIVSESPFFQRGRVTDVVAGGGAIVAARREVSVSLSGADWTVWTWRPDTSWVQSDLAAVGGEHKIVTGLAWHEGTYVAVGRALPPTEPAPLGRSLAWTSTDGLAWTEVESPVEDGEICALEVSPQGDLIALGWEGDLASAWTRSGEGEWTRSDLAGRQRMPDDGATIFDGLCQIVNVGGRTLAALGLLDAVQAWTTFDGMSWSAGPALPTTGYGVGLAAREGTLVYVTSDPEPQPGIHPSTLHVGVADE